MDLLRCAVRPVPVKKYVDPRDSYATAVLVPVVVGYVNDDSHWVEAASFA